MPTRRQLGAQALSAGGTALVAAGGLAALSSCATPPPPAVPPRRHTFLKRTLNGYRRDLIVCDASGRNQKDVVPNAFGRAAWTPDGGHLCVARGVGDDSRGTWALWVLRSDGALLHQITRPAIGIADLDPAFHPNGKTIVFTRDTVGFGTGVGLWIVQADGSGLHYVPGGAGGITPQFNNNGGAIVYAAFDGIRRIPTGGGSARVIARAQFGWQLAQPTWSPDGKHVAFVRHNPGGGDTLCWMAATGGTIWPLHTSPTFIESPAWSRDSNTLTFVKYDGPGEEGRRSATIFREAIGGAPVAIYRTTSPPLTDLSTWAGS